MTPASALTAAFAVVIAVGFMALAVEMGRLSRYVLAALAWLVGVACLGLAASELVSP